MTAVAGVALAEQAADAGASSSSAVVGGAGPARHLSAFFRWRQDPATWQFCYNVAKVLFLNCRPSADECMSWCLNGVEKFRSWCQCR